MHCVVHRDEEDAIGCFSDIAMPTEEKNKQVKQKRTIRESHKNQKGNHDRVTRKPKENQRRIRVTG